jgi:hypothetical protein
MFAAFDRFTARGPEVRARSSEARAAPLHPARRAPAV